MLFTVAALNQKQGGMSIDKFTVKAIEDGHSHLKALAQLMLYSQCRS